MSLCLCTEKFKTYPIRSQSRVESFCVFFSDHQSIITCIFSHKIHQVCFRFRISKTRTPTSTWETVCKIIMCIFWIGIFLIRYTGWYTGHILTLDDDTPSTRGKMSIHVWLPKQTRIRGYFGVRDGVRSGNIWCSDILTCMRRWSTRCCRWMWSMPCCRGTGSVGCFENLMTETWSQHHSVLDIQYKSHTKNCLLSECYKCPEHPSLSRDVIMLLPSHFRNDPRNGVRTIYSWWTWRQDQVLGTHLADFYDCYEFIHYTSEVKVKTKYSNRLK